jgi:AhpD family alkylhydroperoxidase
MGDKLDAFRQFRTAMNERILAEGTRETKRFFQLDGAVYRDGALPAKTKEMLGLVASMVLRCNDCITYHVIECRKAGVTGAEFSEVFDVALIVGGSIVIPHLRHARAILDELSEGPPAAGAAR